MQRISHGAALAFIKEFHYLGTLPSSVKTNFAEISDAGTIEAVACYGPVHAPKMPKSYMELRRLAKREGSQIILSAFLASTLRALKSEGIPAVLSWADPNAGHHGGIYQATNWIYNQPNSYNWNSSYIDENGRTINHRDAFAILGTSAKAKVKILRPDWKPFLPVMKHRYLMPLNASKDECLRAINARELPYPKPAINGEGEKRIASKWRSR